jgi:hypothetical protein
MDRPDEAVCHQCGTALGWFTGERWVFTCRRCGARTQPGSQGTAVAATAEAIRVQDALDRLELEFQHEVEPLYSRLGGGRTGGGKDFAPDEASGCGNVFVLLLCCAGGAWLLWQRLWLPGVGAIALGVAAFGWGLRVDRRRLEQYRAIQSRYQAHKADLIQEISQAID